MNKTYTFAVGREKEPSRSYLYHITKAQNPGPGAVNLLKFSIKIELEREQV
jgi:hypothetical protein